MTLPTTISPTVRRLNPHLFGGQTVGPVPLPVDKPRIRQRRTPLNKTEQRFLDWLKAWIPEEVAIKVQDITFRLANGVRYTPDFVLIRSDGTREDGAGGLDIIAYEVKGPQGIEDDASAKLKMAPRAWPMIQWRLAYEKPPRSGQFVIEEVLP